MNELEIKLCDIQGRLFELSYDNDLDSAVFVKAFMNSEIAKNLDSKYNRMQWAGEEYLLEELESTEDLKKGGERFTKDMLYWMGYIYRYWHFVTDEDSAKIYKQAPVETLKRNYMMFHTLAPEMAIEDLKEIYRQRN